MTYTCTVTKGSVLEWIAEPFLSTNELRFTLSAPADNRSCDDTQCMVFDFQVTVSITNRIAGMSVADLTSTFRFTARAELNGTVVQCRVADIGGLQTNNETVKVVGMWTL